MRKAVAFKKDAKLTMSRLSLFTAPFVLGFDSFEEHFDRLAKSAETYPPYNIERRVEENGSERFLISIAVAGFSRADLDVTVEDNQLVVRGRQSGAQDREFLHRGIATRQFQRSFLLAAGMQVEGANLRDGLLIVTAMQPNVAKLVRTIKIDVSTKE